MDAYIVIGGADSFKSSTVRSLTGCRVRGVRELVHGGIVMDTFVQISSLQEKRPSIAPLDFIKEVRKSGARSVILPLRALAIKPKPDANSYIREFVKYGWNIKGVAILNSPNFQLTVPLPANSVFRYPPGINPLYYANQLASQVRKDFGWL
ncbi:hypothetical protein MAFF211471_03810 [Ralstonia solanacearum]|uniref:Uncharacterized protein n=2 Tax=root TaxID=1 RepID=A0A077KER3_9CAUD|nr:hypothetical protein MA18_gp19 [Ralstonia phage RSY1]BCL85298.1 hypothetical protein MAFF211471_03810 [Ralstonia solanacearum]BEU47058.1 hypothetical protein MAFF211519_23830 [Ralstonia pseudosolanacearum]BAP28120.1 hypothetical protein [Ralstonia phage RSY1]BCM02189.1 hypothetical protein MAFF301560_15760 [Ralstonia solanacearum]BCM97845.1 hypothetical protein RPSA_03820 [Ralstonia solanacearum]